MSVHAGTRTSTMDACQLCGGIDVEPRPRETALACLPPGSGVVRCQGCGLQFASPQVMPTYEADYYHSFGRYSADHVTHMQRLFRGRLERLARVAPRGRLLDVGCAEGLFMTEARARGWNVAGLELSKWASEQARERGFDVRQGSVDDADFPPRSFAVIHMSHVLEHLPRPVTSLRKLRSWLAPKGVLALEVPYEFYDLGEGLLALLGRPRPAKPSSASHFFFFSPRTLSACLERAAFRPLTVRTPRDPYIVRHPAKRLVFRAVGMAERMLRRGPVIEALARPIDGAGA